MLTADNTMTTIPCPKAFKTIPTSISAVEILSGLKPGDKVVVSGTDTFNNATRVSIN
jgi:multidrug efflux pump subunit AcrA (membrane-fusion protein)